MPLRKDKKRESGEEDGYGTGNPPCSEGLRELDLLLRRSRPDVVTGCSTCTGKSNVRGEGSSSPEGKGLTGRKLQLMGEYIFKQEQLDHVNN